MYSKRASLRHNTSPPRWFLCYVCKGARTLPPCPHRELGGSHRNEQTGKGERAQSNSEHLQRCGIFACSTIPLTKALSRRYSQHGYRRCNPTYKQSRPRFTQAHCTPSPSMNPRCLEYSGCGIMRHRLKSNCRGTKFRALSKSAVCRLGRCTGRPPNMQPAHLQLSTSPPQPSSVDKHG